MSVTSVFVAVAIFVLPSIIAGLFSITLFKRYKRDRRSPLSTNLLRGPGETLRSEIEKMSERIDENFFNLLLISIPALAVLLLASRLGNPYILWGLLLAVVIYVASIVWATRRLYLLFKQRSSLYLGLDAELAVGQELNQLMLNGCRVYHDFPAENFNIDHVVAGPGGVYAVETKGRAKPEKGRGRAMRRFSMTGKPFAFLTTRKKPP